MRKVHNIQKSAFLQAVAEVKLYDPAGILHLRLPCVFALAVLALPRQYGMDEVTVMLLER